MRVDGKRIVAPTQAVLRHIAACVARGALRVLVLIVAATTGSAAGQPSARAFVASIYAPYVSRHSEGAGLDTRADYDRAFEPMLASWLFKDAEAAWQRGDHGKLGFDPFMDASEWLVDRVRIGIVHAAARTATATVTFENSGRRTTIKLDLVKLAIGWRIRDIHARSGDLRARYANR